MLKQHRCNFSFECEKKSILVISDASIILSITKNDSENYRRAKLHGLEMIIKRRKKTENFSIKYPSVQRIQKNMFFDFGTFLIIHTWCAKSNSYSVQVFLCSLISLHPLSIQKHSRSDSIWNRIHVCITCNDSIFNWHGKIVMKLTCLRTWIQFHEMLYTQQ